jgi:hypothetical protein
MLGTRRVVHKPAATADEQDVRRKIDNTARRRETRCATRKHNAARFNSSSRRHQQHQQQHNLTHTAAFQSHTIRTIRTIRTSASSQQHRGASKMRTKAVCAWNHGFEGQSTTKRSLLQRRTLASVHHMPGLQA